MLLILRKLRRSFFQPGKLRTYVAYALGEIVLIVVGILIALQISEWNQNSINRDLEQSFLIRIQKDLDKDLINFNEQQTAGLLGLESLKDAIILIHQENTEDDIFKFNELYDAAWIETLAPLDSTFIELESTGRLNLIQNEALRRKILEHYAYYEQMEVEFDRLFAWHKNVSHEMDGKTSILKYVGWNKELFPSRVRSESDWIFLNDPEHPDFQKIEIGVAATSFWINSAIDDYTAIITKTETLKDLIEEAMKTL